MSKQMSHEEITQKFIDAKVVDYNALGRLIAELGPVLATHDKGIYGAVVGKWNTLACMLPVTDLNGAVGNLRDAARVAEAVKGGG